MTVRTETWWGVITVTVIALLAVSVLTGGAVVDPSALDWILIGALVVLLGIGVRTDLSRLQRSASAAIAILVGLNLASRFDTLFARVLSVVLVVVCWLVVVGTAIRRSRS